MPLRTIYLILCVAGAVIPYWPFVAWVSENGLDFRLFLQELFASRIGAFFGLDVMISAVVLVVFVGSEGTRLGMRRLWLPVAAALTVGVSLGLPLFLYMRERRLNA